MSNTKEWGPSLWKSMFIIATNYPITLQKNNKEHESLKRHYKAFYTNLKFMLPCKFCRESYTQFLKELPIDNYLGGRRDMVMWVYKIKDKVNKKLINQERLLLELETDKLKGDGGLTKLKMIELRKKIMYTKPSPSFKEVYDHYMSFKAKSCSKITKTCR